MFIPNDDKKYDLVNTDEEGCFLHIRCTWSTQIMHLVGLYAPNGPTEQKEFFSITVPALLDNLNDEPLVVFGDWNCVLQPKLDRSNHQARDGGAKHLATLLNALDLKDGWRKHFPNSVTFTFTRTSNLNGQLHAQMSRLDRIYVSRSLLLTAEKWGFADYPTSDHNRIP
jgi:exonuclease III